MSKTAFVFPGQGSQHTGMGKDLNDNYAASRRVFEQVDEALERTGHFLTRPTRRLLVVEDDENARTTIVRLLVKHGVEITEAQARNLAGHLQLVVPEFRELAKERTT